MGRSHSAHRGKPKRTDLGGAVKGPPKVIGYDMSAADSGPAIGWMREDPVTREIERQGRLALRAAHRAQR